MLDDVADPAAQLHRVDVRDVLAVEQDAPGGRLDQPVDHPQHGRLAAAGRADQHDQLAARARPGRARARPRCRRGTACGRPRAGSSAPWVASTRALPVRSVCVSAECWPRRSRATPGSPGSTCRTTRRTSAALWRARRADRRGGARRAARRLAAGGARATASARSPARSWASPASSTRSRRWRCSPSSPRCRVRADRRTVLIGLVLYALLVLVRNIAHRAATGAGRRAGGAAGMGYGRAGCSGRSSCRWRCPAS